MTGQRNLLAPALAAFLVACGGEGSPTEPGDGGSRTFSAEVTGDLEDSLRGEALFGSVEDPEHGPVFAIEMSELAGGGVIQLVRVGGETPKAGEYPVADGIDGSPATGDFVALAFDSENGEPVSVFVARSGTVTIAGGDGSSLRGSFSLKAEGGLFSDPDRTLAVTISGSFAAGPGTAAVLATSGTVGSWR